MALIKKFENKTPKLGKNAFVAEGAVVIGDVELGEGASVWYGSVLRGDVGWIKIGARSNIQDNCVVHATSGVSNSEVGEDVTVGHGVIIHGAKIGDRALIGMGSILLDNVEVGEEALVAAGTLLTPGTKVPPRTLVRGRPGKVARELTEQEVLMGREGADHYLILADKHRR